MHTSFRRSASLVAIVLVGAMLSVTAPAAQGSVTPPPAPPTVPTDCRPTTPFAASGGAAPATPQAFAPANNNMVTNNPRGTGPQKRVVTNRILAAINSTPSCGRIQLATWNFRSNETRVALRNAMARGVSVSIVMAAGNDGPRGSEQYNPTWQALSADVNAVNAQRRANGWPQTGLGDTYHRAQTCREACRASSGAAHSKFYMFSRSGSVANVVMYGSHNLTDVAATNQWNDLYTMTGAAPYNHMDGIFRQMILRQKQRNPYVSRQLGQVRMDVWPYTGAGRNQGADPILTALNRVRCTNAGAAGVRNRTAVRIAVSAILNARGQQIANRLVTLRRQGCDIKIVTTNVGIRILKTLKNNRVPIRQLAVYNERQGKYVTYTHTKFMTINGNYAGRANQKVAFNGTANWTASALVSDELLGVTTNGPAVDTYNQFVNRWFGRSTANVRPTTVAVGGRVAGDVWSLVEKDW